MLTSDELQAIRDREQATTPGPWMVAGGAMAPCGILDKGGRCIAGDIDEEYADFFAHARTDIPALLEHIEEQTRKLHVYETALQKLSCLGAGSRQGNSDGNRMAQEALKDALACMKESPCSKN